MAADLFDMTARQLRRDRAFRSGPELFLYERVFEEILERLADVRRRFESALMIGVPDPSWPERLRVVAARVETVDPGAAFARAAGGRQMQEDALDVTPASFDLCVAIGTLDTVNDLPDALLRMRFALKPDSLLIGAIPGGDTLPQLRAAMRAADAVGGGAAPHVHPRIEPAGLAQLLTSADFAMPVVDVDRLAVSYRNLHGLVRDLRAMGATNVLAARQRKPLSRSAVAAAAEHFRAAGENGVTVEKFELLHFAAWSPAQHDHG